MRWNSCEPWLVKLSTTSGWPVWGLVSAVICDSLRSFPVSSGGPFGCPGVPGRAARRADDEPIRRHREYLRVRRLLAAGRQQELMEARLRPLQLSRMGRGLLLRDLLAFDRRRHVLRDLRHAEEVIGLGRALLRLALDSREQGKERRGRRRPPLAHGRRREVLLEVEELQLAGGADDLRRLVGI